MAQPAPLDDEIISFGTRYLTDPKQVFDQNAWDQVELSESAQLNARNTIQTHAQFPVDPALKETIQSNPSRYWNMFYKANTTHFFKDRNWLVNEFRRSSLLTFNTTLPTTICEFGCGTGSTLFPILKYWLQQNLPIFIHACDFSSKAIDLLKENPCFDPQHINALVFDTTNLDLPASIPQGSVDFMVLIFAISAIPFSKWSLVFANIFKLLKPGGTLLLRDYARQDLAQVRMKKGRFLDDNMYMRGDHTLVYFATTDEVRQLALQHGFEILQLGVDQRLLVNRKKKLEMHRLWVHCQLRKPNI